MSSWLTMLTIVGLIGALTAAHQLLLRWLGMQPRSYRQTLTFIFTFVGGSYFFLEFLLPKNVGSFQFGAFHDSIILGVRLFSAMAIGLGIINLLRVHGDNLIKSKKGWTNSLALITALFCVFVIYIGDFRAQETRYQELGEVAVLSSFVDEIEKRIQKNPEKEAALKGALVRGIERIALQTKTSSSFLRASGIEALDKKYNEAHLKSLEIAEHYLQPPTGWAVYTSELKKQLIALQSAARELAEHHYKKSNIKIASEFVFEGFFIPLGSAMFSLLAFYVATAAYRTFRIRSLEAGLMMLTAVLVMLGQIPHGPLYIWEDLPWLRLKILEYLNTPAFRAIFFGSSIAALAMALRMWFSLDASPLASSEEER